jgi:hypothetical protein
MSLVGKSIMNYSRYEINVRYEYTKNILSIAAALLLLWLAAHAVNWLE